MKKRAVVLGLVLSFSSVVKAKTDCDKIKSDELLCLACNIFHESGNQSLNGKIAVGAVTINRVKSLYYPNSICGVVWQKKQFSWTNDKNSEKTTSGPWWNQARDVAKGFLLATGKPHGAFRDPTDCALFYHADYVNPNWNRDRGMKLTKQIGNHLFYKNKSMGCPNENVMAITSRDTDNKINRSLNN